MRSVAIAAAMVFAANVAYAWDECWPTNDIEARLLGYKSMKHAEHCSNLTVLEFDAIMLDADAKTRLDLKREQLAAGCTKADNQNVVDAKGVRWKCDCNGEGENRTCSWEKK
jgi:hypothetical protein